MHHHDSMLSSKQTKSFWKSIYTKGKYLFFYLGTKTQRKIIVMGIHRHPRPYRRSRAGTNLFHTIRSIILQHRDETTITPKHNSVNNSVLILCEGMSNMTNPTQ